MIPLRVNDIKQWNYCPRIVFYNTVMPVSPPPTYKMEHGKDQEDLFAKLETRRVLEKYGISQGERLFRVWLTSERLDLSGKLDLLIRTPRDLFPVDFKYTFQGAFKNHVLQLAAYALLAEEAFSLPANQGFVYAIPKKKLHPVELDSQIKKEALEQLDEIRKMIQSQNLPDPTPFRNRCYNCEYLNYCGDVL